MSFKNKMKNRGISKLDNLVETPDYVTPVQPKKVGWNWLKIAIPVTAGLALIVVPISVFAANGGFSANSSSKSANQTSDSSFAPGDPEYNYDSMPAPSGEAESNVPPIYADTSDTNIDPELMDLNFSAILAKYEIFDNYVIEVNDFIGGAKHQTYIFTGEEANAIVNSLNGLVSDYNAYKAKEKSDDVDKNKNGYLMGINYQFIFKDGLDDAAVHKLRCGYISQFATMLVECSAFDLTGSVAYSIMDTYIEMDYDPTFDETIKP